MVEGIEQEKALAAGAAVKRVRPGMRIALGTGSTAGFALRALAERFPGGGGLAMVASSEGTGRRAQQLGLPVRPLRPEDRFDLMIDGADEVSPKLDLTKGGGGALFREKFLARLSAEVVIAVDHTKLVPRLGVRSPIPVEVVPFACPVVERGLAERGWEPTRRSGRPPDGEFRTDNGNAILDLHPPGGIEDPKAVDRELRAFPGVIETGLFVGLAHRVVVAFPDGSLQELLPGPPAEPGRPAGPRSAADSSGEPL